MLAKPSTRPTALRRAIPAALGLSLLGAGLPAAGAEHPAADRPGPGLSRFHAQRVTWSACTGPDLPEDLQCG
ncbi:alpha/beta hydrolase, partial [Streptomyces sp. TRM76130]|nr:alpha/beta hydrolase [Streptomyces sp. TRM76130]